MRETATLKARDLCADSRKPRYFVRKHTKSSAGARLAPEKALQNLRKLRKKRFLQSLPSPFANSSSFRNRNSVFCENLSSLLQRFRKCLRKSLKIQKISRKKLSFYVHCAFFSFRRLVQSVGERDCERQRRRVLSFLVL